MTEILAASYDANRTTSPRSARAGAAQAGTDKLMTGIRFPSPSITPRTRTAVLESVNRAELLRLEGAASSTMTAQCQNQTVQRAFGPSVPRKDSAITRN